MSRADDLTGLLSPPAEPAFRVRQGVVVAFNQSTGANTIALAGAELVDVPILSGAESLEYAPGDVVILMRVRTSWFILGRVVTPGGAALAPSAIGLGSVGLGVTNFGLTTTFVAKVSQSLVIPDWANQILITMAAYATVENTTAAADFAYIRTSFGGPIGATGHGAVAPVASGHPTKYTHVTAQNTYSGAVTPGASYLVSADMRSSVGTWAAAVGNIVNLSATAIYTRQ